jgi:tetratricopeptide (TPR) repeat protein
MSYFIKQKLLKMTRRCLILIFCLAIFNGQAQSPDNPDILLNQLAVEKDDFAKLELLIEISEYYRQNDITKSVVFGRRASNLAEKLNDNMAIVKAYIQLGEAYFTHHKLDSVDIALSRIEPLVLELNDMLLTANTYMLKGSLAGKRNQFATGVKYLKQSYALHSQIGNKKGVATAANKLGLRYAHQTQHDSAMYYYLDASRSFLSINDSLGHATALANIASLFFRENDYDKALYYISEAIRIYESYNSYRFLVGSYNIKGMAYNYKNMYDESIHYFKKCIDLAERIHYDTELSLVLINLGSVYDAMQQYNEAYIEFTRARELNDQNWKYSGRIQFDGKPGCNTRKMGQL